MANTALANLMALQQATSANMPQQPQGGGGLLSQLTQAEGDLTEAQREQMVGGFFERNFMDTSKVSPTQFDEALAVQQATQGLQQEQALAGGAAGFREGLMGQTISPLEGGRAMSRAEEMAAAGGSAADIASLSQNPQFNPQVAQERRDVNTLRQREMATADANLSKAELAYENMKAGKLDPMQRNTIAQGLGDDFVSITDNFREGITARDQALNLINQNDAVGAALAITKVAKAADPGSTVRVEEGKLVGGSTGLEQRLIDSFRAMRGGGFSPESQIMFKNALGNLTVPLAMEYKQVADAYAGIAERQNINTDEIYRGLYDAERIQGLLPR
jgi:hypothetical protein